jgi:hypothetical protein
MPAPLVINNFPANPECGGTQWLPADEDFLASIVALVLIGRDRIALAVLQDTLATPRPAPTSDQQKAEWKSRLLVTKDKQIEHRDGLIFEVICWIVAELTAGPNEVLSDPHLSPTRQGLDTIKIGYDPQQRQLVRATVHEQKCTIHARQLFQSQVLPAFRKWMQGTRDSELLQAAAGLLQRFNLTNAEYAQAYDRLLQDRPLAFRAALTVTPAPFETAKCVSLFKDYTGITPSIDHRIGDTLPLADIRAWFEAFAQKVWAKIEAGYV